MATEAVIGSDFSVALYGVRDALTGSYLNSATITFQVYNTATGAAVSGGSGSLSYVSASNGDYTGVVDAVTTATLTDGAAYYVAYTGAQSGYDFNPRLDFTARAPGESLLDVATWAEEVGLTLSDADARTVTRMIARVTEILVRKCAPKALFPRTLTLFPLDAPLDRELFVPKPPLRAVTALYYHSGAGGDSSVVDTTADLLTEGVDYMVVRDDPDNPTWSRSGKLLRLNSNCWGYSTVRPVTKLGYKLVPEPGAIFISASCGPATVSPAAQAAASAALTLMFNRRKTGMPLQSESWGGYSYSGAGQFTAESACNSPEVLGILRDAGLLPVHVA